MQKIKELLLRYSSTYVNVIALLCLYAIFQIKFDFAYWVGDSFYAEDINDIITNLSYSYLAGYIFYSLTVTLPYVKMKSKTKKALDSKISAIIVNYEACLESVVPLPTEVKADLTKEEAIDLFRTVSYMSPCRLSSIGQNVNIAMYIKTKHEENQTLAAQLLEYKPWLSSTAIAQIENIRNSNLSNLIIALMQEKLIVLLDTEKSRKRLASDVYDLWNLSKQIKAKI